jgi:hypothetical protein
VFDTSELDVSILKATFAGHFGADPFSKMVRKLKMLHRDRLETMYYYAALHFGLRRPKQVPAFSNSKILWATLDTRRQGNTSGSTAELDANSALLEKISVNSESKSSPNFL